MRSKSSLHFVLESDNLNLVRAVTDKEKASWEAEGLIKACKSEMAHFEKLRLAHYAREANKVANWVTTHRRNYLPRDWLTNPPNVLWDLIVFKAHVLCNG
ncbi:hypothetical protein NL676_025762 [Syzygium grande]|nr:hypothetical protein NL676_025762 [Syzygium grande]